MSKNVIVVKPFRRIINQPKLFHLIERVNGRAASAGPMISLGIFTNTHKTLDYQMFHDPTTCALYVLTTISIISTVSMMTYDFEQEKDDKYEKFETAVGRVAMGFWLSLMIS
tara:strand:+ start:1123 stop:1458 length:336 start_codon:yes stop_codon:yes gene_type:complete